MLKINLEDCPKFIGGDNTILRELLHPAKQDFTFRYSLAHATVVPGEESLSHKLASSEVYYILEGRGVVYIDNEEAAVGPGQAIYIPPRAVQYIRNTGDTDLKFLCIVEPAWKAEHEEVL